MHTKAMHGTSSVTYLIRFRSAKIGKAAHGPGSVTWLKPREHTHRQRQCMALAQWHCFSQKAQAKKAHTHTKAVHGTSSVTLLFTESSSQENTQHRSA